MLSNSSPVQAGQDALCLHKKQTALAGRGERLHMSKAAVKLPGKRVSATLRMARGELLARSRRAKAAVKLPGKRVSATLRMARGELLARSRRAKAAVKAVKP